MGIGHDCGWRHVTEASQRPAVFLDRDGVLIEAIVWDNKPFAATSPEDVRIIDGAREACAELSSLGFLLVMVTNQPDISRGKISQLFVDQVNADIARKLSLDAVRVCAHDDRDACLCRKPKPGMMIEAGAALNIDLSSSVVVGDRWRDIEAGKRAGCKTVFIDYGYDEPLRSVPDHTTSSLRQAVFWIRDQTPSQRISECHKN